MSLSAADKKMSSKLVLLFLTTLLPATGANQNTLSTHCADYLRCRNDELEHRWKCNEENRRILTDICRVERHLRSLKRLTLRRETDFAVCLAKAASELDAKGVKLVDSCSNTLLTPPNPHSLECRHRDGTFTSSCLALRQCCPAAPRCESRMQYTALSSFLNAERAAAEVLLRSCRADINSFVPANLNQTNRELTTNFRSDRAIATSVAQSITSLLKFIEEDIDVSIASPEKTPQDPHVVTFANGSALVKKPVLNKGSSALAPAAPLLPISEHTSLRSLLTAHELKINELAAQKKSYRNRTANSETSVSSSISSTLTTPPKSRMYGYATKRLISFGVPAQHHLISNIDNETKHRLPNTSILPVRDDTASVRRKPMTRRPPPPPPASPGHLADQIEEQPPRGVSPNSVELIVDRIERPPVELTIDRSHQFLGRPFAPEQAREFAQGREQAVLTFTEARNHNTPRSFTSLSTNFLPQSPEFLLHPTHQPHQLRTTIRKPWSDRTRNFKIGNRPWIGHSNAKQSPFDWNQGNLKNQGFLKSWKPTTTRSIQLRPIDSFRDHIVKFPENTDKVTDIAIPTQNRLKNRKRIKPKWKNTSQGFTSLNRVVTKGPTPSPVSKRVPFLSPEDVIYEDILEQERKMLKSKNIPLPNEDFDDPWSIRQSLPPSSLSTSKTTRSNPSIHISSSSKGPVFFRNRRRLRVLKKVMRGTATSTTPIPTSITSTEDSGLLNSTDDPLDGIIVEAPLNAFEDITTDREELKQITDTKPENLVAFEKAVTTEPISTEVTTPMQPVVDEASTDEPASSQLFSETESNKMSEESFLSPSFSTVPLPSDESAMVTSEEIEETAETTNFDFPTSTSSTDRSLLPSSPITLPPMPVSMDEVTIIPTLKQTEWTAPPMDPNFHFELIPTPSPNDEIRSLVALDEISAFAETDRNGAETTTGEPSTTEDIPQSIDEPLERSLRRMRVFGAKTVTDREPILEPFPAEVSKNRNESEAVSVLQLPETSLRLSHCEAYSLCLDEMSRQELECQKEDKEAGRPLSGFPSRRRGYCNRQLISEYLAVHEETKNLEVDYSRCIKSRLGEKITALKPAKCGAYSFPPTFGLEPCRSKLHVIKYHCSKLMRCCPDAERCRDEVDRSDAARQLKRRKELLALEATKCQIQNYKDYRERSRRRRGRHLRTL